MHSKLIAGVVAFLGSLSLVTAQDFNDPYSSYGIGNIQNIEFTHRMGAAPLGLVHQEQASYSLQNPASLSHLRYTTFNMGVNGEFYGLARRDSNYTDNQIGFGYLTLGFPVMKSIGWGASFGIVPFSQLGFQQAFDPQTNLDYQILSTGDGGITKFFFGNGFRIAKNLNVGVNVGYLFGEMERSRIREFAFTERFLSSRTVTSRKVGDFIFEGGLQYKYALNKTYELLVGAKARIPWEVNYNVNATTFTYPNNPAVSFEELKRLGGVDTVDQTDDQTRNIYLPGSYKTTVALQKGKDWKLGLGVVYEPWSNLRVGGESQSLGDRTKISLSGERLPSKESLSSYGERMGLRFGIEYANSYLKPAGETVNRYEVQAGVSFPISQQQSRVNLGLAYGQLGTDANGLFRKRFFKLRLGLNLNERWFQSQKVK